MSNIVARTEEFDVRDTHIRDVYYYCPKCNFGFGSTKLFEVEYCYKCGQKIEWSKPTFADESILKGENRVKHKTGEDNDEI